MPNFTRYRLLSTVATAIGAAALGLVLTTGDASAGGRNGKFRGVYGGHGVSKGYSGYRGGYRGRHYRRSYRPGPRRHYRSSSHGFALFPLGILLGAVIANSVQPAYSAGAYDNTGVTYQPPPPATAPGVVTVQTQAPEYCREYQTTVTVNGEQQEAFGTACRQPDGSWQRR